MPKPLRLPNASEQALLDGLNLRLLTDPEDKQRWDELVSQLSCWRNPKTGRREVPSSSTFFRALKVVSYDTLEPLLVGWQDDLLGPADPKELVVLDGKVARAAGGQTVISAVAVPSGRVLGIEVVRTKEELHPDDRPTAASAAAPGNAPVEPAPPTPATPAVPATPAAPVAATASAAATTVVVAALPQAPPPSPAQSTPAPATTAKKENTTAKKENEIPAARRLLARIPIQGRLVSLDAMHTQHQTAAQIVIDAGADYLLTLKDNQPTLTETVQTLIPSAFFPSGPRGKQKAHGPNGGAEP